MWVVICLLAEDVAWVETVHGPYHDKDEAQEVANAIREEAGWSRKAWIRTLDPTPGKGRYA